MNRDIEKTFVDKFVRKNKRERVLYELALPAKRSHIIQKIIEFLDTNYIVYDKAKVSDEEVFSKIKEYTDITQMCYVIGDTSDDGKTIPLAVAFNHMMHGGGVYVIVCNDGNVVVIKEEVCFPPSKMILYRK